MTAHGLVALAEALGSGNRVDLSWMDSAKCRETVEIHNGKKFADVVNPDEWAAPRGDDDKAVRKLRSVCARCPVTRECLVWAMTSPHSIEFGVYGGTTGSQRMKYRNNARIVEILHRWFAGWKRASDKTQYERETRRKAWKQLQTASSR